MRPWMLLVAVIVAGLIGCKEEGSLSAIKERAQSSYRKDQFITTRAEAVKLLDAAQQANNSRMIGEAYLLLAKAYSFLQEDVNQGQQYIDSTAFVARQLNDSALMAEVRLCEGQLLEAGGKVEEAKARIQEALQYCEKKEDDHCQYVKLAGHYKLGLIYKQNLYPDSSIHHFQQALMAGPENHIIKAYAHEQLSHVFYDNKGAIDKAAKHLIECYKIGRVKENALMQASSMIYISGILVQAGLYDEALLSIQKIDPLIPAQKRPDLEFIRDWNMAFIMEGKREPDSILYYMGRQLGSPNMDIPYYRGFAYTKMGIAYAQLELQDHALLAFSESMDAFQSMPEAQVFLPMIEVLGHTSAIYMDQSNPQEAHQMLEKAITLYEKYEGSSAGAKRYQMEAQLRELLYQQDSALVYLKRYIEKNKKEQQLNISAASGIVDFLQNDLIKEGKAETEREAKKWLIAGFAFAMCALTVAVFSYYKRKHSKTELKKAWLENQKLTAEYREALKSIELKIKELESLNAYAAHEFVTPIYTMEHTIELMEMSLRSSSGQEALESANHKLKESLDRLKLITNGVRSFIQADQTKLLHKSIDLQNMIKRITGELQQQFPEHILRLDFGETSDIYGDPTLIRSALWNLLENAFKYSQQEASPSVTVMTGKEKGTTFVTIRDNGIGLTEKDKAAIFNIFYRGIHKNSFRGSGIGLFIVKRIIERHKGSVDAESEGEGKGSTFRICFPENGSDRQE